jgi:hypothetical protein
LRLPLTLRRLRIAIAVPPPDRRAFASAVLAGQEAIDPYGEIALSSKPVRSARKGRTREA